MDNNYSRNNSENSRGAAPQQPAGYNQNPYAQNGYSRNPYTQNSYARNPGDQNSYTQNSYGRNGYAQNPYTQNGYAQDPYAQNGYARNPYAQNGYAQNPYAQNGYARNPGDQNGYAQDPYTQNGYARNPSDQNGYTQDPYGRNAYAQNSGAPAGSEPIQPFRPNKKLAFMVTIIAVILEVLLVGAFAAVFFLTPKTADQSSAAETTAEETAEDTEPDAETTEDTEAVSVVVTGEQTDYDAACAQMDAGNYRQAAEMFEALGDFSDSADLAEECLQEADYADAQSMLDAGDYQGAAELLEQLGDFKDSADLLARCSLCLPQSAVDEMDSYFRQTLQDTFNGSDWRYDSLSNMKLLGYYEVIGKINGPSDNYVYLLYRITAYNSYTGKTTDYYWFGCYEDVAVSDSGAVSQTSRTCFTNGAGSAYKIYVSGSSQFYYYGFETRADFEADRITPLESNYFWTWTDAE